MPINCIDNKLIDCMLFALDIDYNIGLFYIISYDNASSEKIITQSTCCNCNGHLNLIHSPPHQHRSTVQVVGYNILPRRKQRINVPPEEAPQQSRGCTNHRKTNNFSRRRISSPIYDAARHYHHQLTFKGVGYRCLVGYYATRRQIEAYGGRRWPSSFHRRGCGLPSLFVRRAKRLLAFRQLLASYRQSRYVLLRPMILNVTDRLTLTIKRVQSFLG